VRINVDYYEVGLWLSAIHYAGWSMAEREKGPISYVNWRRARNGEPEIGAYEFPLYTDGRVISEIPVGTPGFEGCAFINTVPIGEGLGLLRPAVVLRLTDHLPPGVVVPDMTKTDTSLYHGGDLEDEFAALLSVCLGLRFWASGASRTFRPGGDPRGRPQEFLSEIPTITVRTRTPIIPGIARPAELELLAPLKQFPDLEPDDATAFIRAARAYQQGLWVCDSDPNLAWLLLVSAVEVVADQWFVGGADEEALLREHKADLVAQMEAIGCGEAIGPVAREFAQVMKSTAKFMGAIMHFIPPPPADRPPWGQLDWAPSAMKKSVALVYKYRSKALHEATPFPHPMCQPPYGEAGWDAPAEVPIGGATSAQFGVWRREDLPMYLYVFEYIVRACLLAWLSSGGAKRANGKPLSAPAAAMPPHE